MYSNIFFFQAEDGIRDGHVTGVQTCALPILAHSAVECAMQLHEQVAGRLDQVDKIVIETQERSEERRVGKECRSRRSPYPWQTKRANTRTEVPALDEGELHWTQHTRTRLIER